MKQTTTRNENPYQKLPDVQSFPADVIQCMEKKHHLFDA
jgi:hypothetical protein